MVKASRVWIVMALVILALVGLARAGLAYGVGKFLPPRLEAGEQAVAELAKDDLVTRQELSPSRVRVKAVEKVIFPDTSIGVLALGQRYLEFPTPGYVVWLTAAGATYEYHGSGERVVLVPGEGTSYDKAQRLLWSSLDDLKSRLDVALDELVAQSITPTEFPDASLGVPELGMSYAQVVTPGFVIHIEVKGVVYEYRASGDRIVYVQSYLQPYRKVTLFFGNIMHNPELLDCGKVFPLEREVAVTPEASSTVTLRELFAGPTREEAAQGYVSVFSDATRDLLKSVRRVGDTAYVDLVDLRQSLPAANTACGGQAFFAEVETTLKAVLPVERVIYAFDGDPVAFYEWMQLGCDPSDNRCDPTPFQANPKGTQPRDLVSSDPFLLLPDAAHLLSQVSTDLNGDGEDERVLLTGFGGSPQRLGYDWLQLFVLAQAGQGQYRVAWQSGQLAGDRGQSLRPEDVNGDQQPEVVSIQSMGATGETLYLLSWTDQGYEFLRPNGGFFAGWESFGENAVRLDDLDGDGSPEILAGHGPAASSVDVYRWDGHTYVYLETLNEAVPEL